MKLVSSTTIMLFFLFMKNVWNNILVHAGTNFFDSEHTQNKRLGSCGLALHYANIINQIENIVSLSDKPCNVYLFLFDVSLSLYIMAWQQISILSPVHPEYCELSLCLVATKY